MKGFISLSYVLMALLSFNSHASNCFENLLVLREKAVSTRALQKEIIKITGQRVTAEEAVEEAQDMLIWAFGRLRPLDEKLSKFLTEGKYVYEINGQTGFVTMEKSASGKLLISHIGNHSPSDNDVVVKAMLGFQDRGYEFTSKTQIEILHNPTGRYGGVENALDVTKDLRTPPTFLSRSRKKYSIAKEEVEKAGKILNSVKDENLRDGEYVFLTLFNKKTGTYRTVYSSMYAPQDNGKFYAGHRSLRRKFKNKNEVVVSAGEFEIQFGQFAKLSNRSGTYMGHQNHLSHAYETFSNLGFWLKDTKLVDYSELRRLQAYTDELREAGVHNDSIYRTTRKHELVSDESLHELHKTTLLFLYRLHKNFPAKQAGRIDVSKFNAFLKENMVRTKESSGHQLFLAVFLDVQRTDGTATAIMNGLSPYSSAQDMIDAFKMALDVVPINRPF
jgi:hypothetical protein